LAQADSAAASSFSSNMKKTGNRSRLKAFVHLLYPLGLQFMVSLPIAKSFIR